MDRSKKERISLADTYRNILSTVTPEHVFYMQIVATAIIGLIILYVLTRRIAKSVSGRSVVFVGGCEAGKTSILYTLTQGETPLTVTTFKENFASYNTGKKSVRLIDVPGHERVRHSAFDRHKSDARAIVFLLDSATLNTNVQDVAEQLFSVLSDPSVQSCRCPIAIACNKQDHELAKGASVIERALQKELEVLRETNSSRLDTISGDQQTSASIGKSGQAFQFSHHSANTITFLETSVKSDMASLKQWIEQVA